MGFGGECGGSRAARADGAVVWVWNRRSEQLERMERDWAAHTTAFGTAGASKWVNRHEYCLTISIKFRRVPAGDRPRKQPSGVWGPTPIGNSWQGRVGQAGLLFRGSYYTLLLSLLRVRVRPELGRWACKKMAGTLALTSTGQEQIWLQMGRRRCSADV